ncbi:hypothetical protein, partial [Streptomyces sp. bgisy060]
MLVASAGLPTELDLASSSVPSVVDLDQNDGRATHTWSLSRYNGEGTVTLRHLATGKKAQRPLHPHHHGPLRGRGHRVQLGLLTR